MNRVTRLLKNIGIFALYAAAFAVAWIIKDQLGIPDIAVICLVISLIYLSLNYRIFSIEEDLQFAKQEIDELKGKFDTELDLLDRRCRVLSDRLDEIDPSWAERQWQKTIKDFM